MRRTKIEGHNRFVALVFLAFTILIVADWQSVIFVSFLSGVLSVVGCTAIAFHKVLEHLEVDVEARRAK